MPKAFGVFNRNQTGRLNAKFSEITHGH
jgi:hypothetical protein